MKLFGRDPALYLALLISVLQLGSSLLELSSDQQNALSVIATAVFTVALAFTVRPIQPAVITGGLSTIVTALVAFQVEVPADWVSAGNALIVAVLTLVLRLQVKPVPAIDPRIS